MSRTADRLRELGLILPAPLSLPPGAKLPFPWVRVVGERALISGHGPTETDGALALPLGKVGRALGDLDRITSWIRIFCMVNSAPGFNQQPAVINGFSNLILELPFDVPVEIEGEIVIGPVRQGRQFRR
ncbi:MAG: RidA family protein [Steroidobacteraceae bacterium]